MTSPHPTAGDPTTPLAATSIIPLARPAGDDQAALEHEFKKAIAADQEGLIIKQPHSAYQPGRRGQAWKKLKGVMPTLDCAVVAAQQGHGKRAGVLSDYTFAVRDESSGELRTLGKAYSGSPMMKSKNSPTTSSELPSRRSQPGPQSRTNDRAEIAFDKIRPSKRHDSGLPFVFPVSRPFGGTKRREK